MSIKLDLHVHSIFHGKTFIEPRQLERTFKKRYLDGVAITNFFNISHAVWLKKELKDFIIIVGQEMWTNDGHIIGLGLKERIADFQSAEETIAAIHRQGGIAVAPHPYLFLGIREKITSLPIDVVESYNAFMGAAVLPNFLAMTTASKRNIPQIACTDTTNAELVGLSHTEVIADDESQIFDAIKMGKVRLNKKALPVPYSFILKNTFNFRDIELCSPHAVPCFICGNSMAVRVYKKECKCLDCGRIEFSRILCAKGKGHYLCKPCIIKRSVNSSIRSYVQ